MEEALQVRRIDELPPELAELVTTSLNESFRALLRLRDDWETGCNRFEGHAEALFEARLGTRLVAICGLNRDPFADRDTYGRLRHLYVVPDCRRSGIGRALVSAALELARGNFSRVRLRTHSPEASRFYLALGFKATAQVPQCTHEIRTP